MSLFTGGNISNVEDLRSYDTSVLEVASAENVDLAAKLELARTEIGIELEEFMARRCGRNAGLPGASGPALANVVVTPVLKQWHTLRTLSLIYADVQANLVDSRYEGKWKEHRQRAQWAAEMLFRIGVGFVGDPVAKAEQPQVRALPGNLPAATYYVRVAWRNRRDESGVASDPVIHTLAGAGVIGVQAFQPPPNAVGFDVYAGPVEAEISRQNSALINPAREWVLPETGLVDGEPLPGGQQPDWYMRNDRILQRG